MMHWITKMGQRIPMTGGLTLPAGLRGISGSGTIREGTKCAGRRCLSSAMMASESTAAGLTKPTRRSVPEGSFMTMAAASFTPGASMSTASTSPSSIRKPRSFTCKRSSKHFSVGRHTKLEHKTIGRSNELLDVHSHSMQGVHLRTHTIRIVTHLVVEAA